VGSLDSSIRSAARATSSAYKRLPIRWRLAGGSAALTLVILCGFAVIVGVLTTRQIHEDFRREVETSADRIVRQARLQLDIDQDGNRVVRSGPGSIDLGDVASSSGAAIRVITKDDYVGYATSNAPDFGPPLARTTEVGGWRVETRPVAVAGWSDPWALQYAQPISEIQDTANRVKVFLAFGVLGGALLALLAGLAVARRAMEPIAELTDAARRIEQTRDPTQKVPHSEAEDEVAELGRTLEAMLASLGEARAETEGALARQREFVADASHELRTPLTSVLANLELLEYELAGEQREAAASALRSSRRMRRLVADLLLLARADAGREAPAVPVDLAAIAREAAGEAGALSSNHPVSLDLPEQATVLGVADDLHRMVANLIENALLHTPPGTPVTVSVRRAHDAVTLEVADRGPGVPVEMRERVFERFSSGTADGARSHGTGLGLAIVKAVADGHAGRVELVEAPGGGARFVVTLPATEAEPFRSDRADSVFPSREA
jgi:two-component system, OmpR family, sensor kinase